MSLNLVITMMDRDRRESMEAIFKSVGLPMSLTMLGRGTATMEHLSLNGLKATEKAVLSTVADSDKPRQLMLAAKVKIIHFKSVLILSSILLKINSLVLKLAKKKTLT